MRDSIFTVGDLSAQMIGARRFIIQHDGSTLSGILTALTIDADMIRDQHIDGTAKIFPGNVEVTITLGSITIGPLPRDYPCEVIGNA